MIEASHSRYLWRLGRVFNLCPLFVLDMNHSDQWNTLLSIGGEIFQLTKGYSQVHGIDYNETYEPVENMDSIRLALAVVASKQWEVHHMDVKCAFLNGDIIEEIYMQQPQGFLINPSFVCRLKKSLYGLK